MTAQDIARLIDHSILHPTSTDSDLEQACALADEYQVATVCVKPYQTIRAAVLLSGSPVGVCSVIGFPHGNSSKEIKAAEAREVLDHGATEVDMVVNIGKVLQGDWGYVDAEIAAVSALCIEREALLKVIFETDYLQDDDTKIRLCECCNRHAVAFAKTSTGFGFVRGDDGCYGYRGATEHDVSLMRQHCDPAIQIKASGGIRTLDQLLRFHALGATRIGTSGTEAIVKEAKARFG